MRVAPLRFAHRARCGTTLVESAVVLLITLLLIFSIFEYGHFVFVRQLVENATREGARQAIAGTSTMTTADVQKVVFDMLCNQGINNTSGTKLKSTDISVYMAAPGTTTAATPDSTWSNAAFGKPIVVQVNATYKPMLLSLGFLNASVPMKCTVVMLSEAN